MVSVSVSVFVSGGQPHLFGAIADTQSEGR